MLKPEGGKQSLSSGFTNSAGLTFTIVSATNLALSLGDWPVLGPATESTPGQYQFTEPLDTNHERRFCRVRSP